MRYKKNGGVAPGSGKTQCSSIGQNQNNEFMKFLDKWMELENIILSEVTQTQKINQSLTKKWI